MCTSCKDPGLSGYPTWYSCRYSTYSGQGGHGQKRHGWAQDELGPWLQRPTATVARSTHTESPRGHDGRRDTRTAGPIGLRVVATEQAGLHAPASRPHVSAVCKDRPHIRPRSNVSSGLLPSAICVPAWPHRGDPRRDLGHGRPTQAGELIKNCRVPSACVLVPECLRTCGLESSLPGTSNPHRGYCLPMNVTRP